MLDDVNTTTHSTDPNIYHAPRDISKPSLCEGFHLPNRFRVDGLGVGVEMSVEPINRNGRYVFACTSLTVLPTENTSGLDVVERIPVSTLLSMAVKCSRIVCVYYPAHYEGDVLDHKLRPVNATRRVDENPYIEPVKLSPPKGMTWTDDAVNKLIGKPPRRRKTEITDEFLQEVADVYNNAGTFPLKAVMKHFHNSPKTTADKWVSKCRELGYIPTTKKRATK